MEAEPPSMCLVSAKELFPLGAVSLEEPQLQIPFTPLYGESVRHIGRTQDGLITLSNYRIHITEKSYKGIEERSLPLGLIDLAEVRDLFQLTLFCKDVRVVRCSFSTNEQCSDWYRRITSAISPPSIIEGYFAFPFHAWVSQVVQGRNLHQEEPPTSGEAVSVDWLPMLQRAPKSLQQNDFRDEVERLQFDLHGAWRISKVNLEYLLCQSYPRHLLVPACISDDTLETVAKFRSSRRIPAVVWRHRGNGAVIARCSQPEVGWLGWRSSEDEELMKAVADACAFDHGHWRNAGCNEPGTPSGNNYFNEAADPFSFGACLYDDRNLKSTTPPPASPEGSHVEVDAQEVKKVLIVDARSYTSAVTNRARGGGCECPEYYNAEIQFMSLGNIHVIRKSFTSLRNLCAMPADCTNWLTLLERTHWLQHLSGLMRASLTVVKAVHHAGRPVLVHCSDGWDRTPQIVATAQLCLDPYYRTREGFRTLVDREWLSFGHKFADRGGHEPGITPDMNERCPVFLQWLDVVHQLVRQFPCSFEFSMPYLIKLAQHSHSSLFGTFLCNSDQERLTYRIADRTFSVWAFLANPAFRNHLYTGQRESVLWPQHNVRDLVLWAEVYMSGQDGCRSASSTDQEVDLDVETGLMTKTRSYGDLLTAGVVARGQPPCTRRSSDPSISVDMIQMNNINLKDGSVDDSEASEPDLDSYTSDSNNIEIFNDVQTLYSHNQLERRPSELKELNGDHRRSKGFNIGQFTESDNSNNSTHRESLTNINKNSTDGQTLISDIDLSIDEWDKETHEDICSCKRYNNCDVSDNLTSICNNSVIEEPERSLHHGHQVYSENINNHSNYPSVESSTDTLVSMQQCSYDTGQNIQHQSPSYSIICAKTNDDYICQKIPPQCLKRIDDQSANKNSITMKQNVSPLSVSPIIESTPLTFAGAIERIDGLCHSISEEGLRLQQLMFDNKLREDTLKRELNGAQLALLKQECQHCQGARTGDLTVLQLCEENRQEEMGSLTDSVSASATSDCSWEAVEERVATIHGIRNSTNVLWVPDHAVSRCTGCNGQFWIGRRKHHCRSCGCIFCADCAENFAPLPTENLYNPVRLCTPCYQNQTKIPEACKNEAANDRASFCNTQLEARIN